METSISTRVRRWFTKRFKYGLTLGSNIDANIREFAVDVDSHFAGLVNMSKEGWFNEEKGELCEGYPISSDDVVLDVGCGTGGYILFCARRGAHVIFADTDSKKIDMLRQHMAATSARQYTGLVTDCAPIPLEDCTATKIICSDVLEHVENTGMFMSELVRVGRPGCLYLIVVPDAVSEKIQKLVASPAHYKAPNHINIFEREEFKRLITESGLVIEKEQFTGFYWSIWLLLYWTTFKHSGREFKGATHDQVMPPYHPLLMDWATMWRNIMLYPEWEPVHHVLNELFPKSHVIIARKQV